MDIKYTPPAKKIKYSFIEMSAIIEDIKVEMSTKIEEKTESSKKDEMCYFDEDFIEIDLK